MTKKTGVFGFDGKCEKCGKKLKENWKNEV